MSALGLVEADVRSIVEAIVLGGIGGCLHWFAVDSSTSKRAGAKAFVVGMVAALGALWLTPPATPLICIAQSVLVGFFGQALLATLQARITAGIATDRLKQVEAQARVAIAALPPPPPNGPIANPIANDPASGAPPTLSGQTREALSNIIAVASGPRTT